MDADIRGAAVGDTQKDVLKQLKTYVLELRESGWYDQAFFQDFEQVILRVLTIKVVPEYRVRNRTYPCKTPILLKLPCAVGERATGMHAAVLPTVDVTFEFASDANLEDLAAHYVRQALAGRAPRDIVPYLPPEKIWIDSLRITFPTSDNPKFEEEAPLPLAAIADPLTGRELRKTSRTWERDKEVRDLVARLAEPTGSICLVGKNGCGKTSVLIEAAARVERTRRDKTRKGTRAPQLFWLTSGGRIVAGMRYLGQWEERLEEVIEELQHAEGVLCIENLLELVRLGGSGPETSLGAFLVPYLVHGELRIVAEATPEEIEACERILPGLVDQLQTVKLDPFTPEQSRKVLKKAGEALGASEGIPFAIEAPTAAFSLFQRFQPYSGFPGRAISFLAETAASASTPPDVPEAITAAHVRSRFGEVTGLPAAYLDDAIPFRFDTVLENFEKRILGQPGATRAITSSLARFKAGLNDPARPLGVFLFTGPTGVGKTALARALGDHLFPQRPERDRVVRLDMSEYAGYDASRRLLGDPYGEPSELVRRIRTNPFGILLLDEIEKASPEVFDIFMNVFEEGRLTDIFGRVTYFQSTLIIMTSNLGSGGSGTVGFTDPDKVAGPVDESIVKKFFRPEFFNRLDRVVPFSGLERDTILKITAGELNAIAKRSGAERRGLTLHFASDLIESLAETGFDPKLGARPLQRTIEQRVTVPLARYLLKKRELSDVTLKVSISGDSVEFSYPSKGQ